MRSAAFVLALTALASCKERNGANDAPDSGVIEPFIDRGVGFSITRLPDWEARVAADSTTKLDLRRKPTPGFVYLVEPRLVVHEEPFPPGLDLDAIARSQLESIQALGATGGLTLKRSSVTHRTIDGVDTAELELAYRVRQATDERDVVQRSLIAKRRRAGEDVMISISISYLAEADNAIGPEIFRMLGSVRFPPPEGRSAALPE